MISYCHEHHLMWDRDDYEDCPRCMTKTIDDDDVRKVMDTLADRAAQLAYNIGSDEAGISDHTYRAYASAIRAAVSMTKAIDDLIAYGPPPPAPSDPPYVPIFL